MLIDIIKENVLTECNKPGNLLDLTFFEQHILKVVEFSKKLAGILSADSEVVELSAYLHDIAAVQNINTIAEHHTLGAGIAKKILLEMEYPSEKADLVSKCIQSHISPIQRGNGTVEEVCLSNADAMSQITMPAYWLYFAFVIRKCNFEKGREWLSQRVESNWNSLITPAKNIIQKEYELTKSFLIHN